MTTWRRGLGQPGDRVAQLMMLGEPADPRADELHGRHLGQHRNEALLDDLEAGQRLAELAALAAVGERGVVGANGVPERAGGDGQPGRGEDLGGSILEGVRAGEAIAGGDAHAGHFDVGLPHGATAALALDHPRLEPGSTAFDQEALDLVILGVPRPDHDDVGHPPVADPLLGTVDHVLVALAAGRGLQRHGVRPMIWLGQRERAESLTPGHRRQPALLLLLAAEHSDRAHRQPGLNAEAAIAPAQLHLNQTRRDGAHGGQP